MNLYDFTDTSDLDPAIAARLENKRTVATPEWVGSLVALIAGAPQALSIAQVLAVAARAEIELPAETTVRNWLNKAVQSGEIGKPSRQSYSSVEIAVAAAEAAATPAVEDDEAPAADVEAPVDLADELADL